jgi:phage terminase large subunit-like protein
LNREDKLELLKLLEEKERRKRGRKILGYYPDAGPLRRELYPKHMQFFEAGHEKRQRLFLAANRIGKCISGDTLIESPYGEARMVKDITTTHWVWAWDGEKKVPALAFPPFMKPSEMTYRVWLQSGRYVDCAAEHRFLTSSGWIFLSHLFGFVPALPCSSLESLQSCVGALPVQPESSLDPRESIAVPGPLTSVEDVRYWMNRLPDSRVDYRSECHLDDEQLPSGQDSDRVYSPSRGDAQRHIQFASHSDVRGDRCNNIPSQAACHLSNTGVLRQISDRFSEFLIRAFYTFAQWYPCSLQESLQPSIVGAARPQQRSEVSTHLNSNALAFLTPDGNLETVVCLQPIGVQPIYDFHVPKFKNYCTAGFIHHNTEGAGGYEMTLHLTGNYPAWWTGHRFTKPILAWASGNTSKTTRDIIQTKLFGPLSDLGTGLIPKEHIVGRPTAKPGVSDAFEIAHVKHASGGASQLVLKSYDQGRTAFEGTEIDVIWLDEEPKQEIYTECLLRTMTNDGKIMLTFTPLLGMSEVVMSFLPGGSIQDVSADASKFVVMGTWDDVPHLTEAAKKELWESIPPFQRDARSKGIPQLGAGAIYPVPESDFLVDDFPIPDHWPRVYGTDVGWNRTAVAWGALDRDTDTLYLYSEHYRGQAEPSIHAQAVKARGDWIPGVIDPASRGRTQVDGQQLLETYINLGLNVEPAFNGVESGIYEVWQRLSSGRLKVFRSLSNFMFEFRLYRRDEKGNIVKTHDHLMDAVRYLVMSGLDVAKTKPVPKVAEPTEYYGGGGGSWMG